MALVRGNRKDMPADAIVLSKEEATKHQIRLMQSWKTKSDTFAFRYGGAMLGSVSALVGIYVNNYYRRKYKLFNYGRMSSYLPIVVLPAALSFLFHTQFVTIQVTLPETCAVCVEMRASAIQAFTGCVLPTMMAPVAAIPLAMQYHTYDVPYITKEPMKVFRLLQKQTKPIANILMAMFLGQALLASTVTYFEVKSVHTVHTKLAKLEQELDSKYNE